jgi:hypothetical protein
MRYVIVAIIFVAGCTTQAPVLSIQDRAGLGAYMAYQAITVEKPPSPPSPAPSPDSGDTCDECGGSGKLGDGTVFVRCSACNGTGKKQDAPEPQPEIAPTVKAMTIGPERYAVPPKGDSRTFRKVCRNGKCHWEPVP